jgi:hypothetical protein
MKINQRFLKKKSIKSKKTQNGMSRMNLISCSDIAAMLCSNRICSDTARPIRPGRGEACERTMGFKDQRRWRTSSRRSSMRMTAGVIGGKDGGIWPMTRRRWRNREENDGQRVATTARIGP